MLSTALVDNSEVFSTVTSLLGSIYNSLVGVASIFYAIILELCPILIDCYYAQNYAGIIIASLFLVKCLRIPSSSGTYKCLGSQLWAPLYPEKSKEAVKVSQP